MFFYLAIFFIIVSIIALPAYYFADTAVHRKFWIAKPNVFNDNFVFKHFWPILSKSTLKYSILRLALHIFMSVILIIIQLVPIIVILPFENQESSTLLYVYWSLFALYIIIATLILFHSIKQYLKFINWSKSNNQLEELNLLIKNYKQEIINNKESLQLPLELEKNWFFRFQEKRFKKSILKQKNQTINLYYSYYFFMHFTRTRLKIMRYEEYFDIVAKRFFMMAFN